MLPSIFGENLFDDFFNDNFERAFWGRRDPLYGKHGRNLMRTDVKETDSAYELDVDLPGFAKEDIHIDLEQGYLTISAAKSLDKDQNGRYIRQERYSGQCSRSFYIGDVQPEQIQAKYENGILNITIQKETEKKATESRILIE